MKHTADGLVPKARLVSRGFEEEGLQEIPKDSLTCLNPFFTKGGGVKPTPQRFYLDNF